MQNDFCQRVLGQLPEAFVLDDLHRVLTPERRQTDPADVTADRAVRGILLLAESNYEVHFAPTTRLTQRVLFPSTASQRNGIEDARFVRFQNDDGGFSYYATYTAYDGKITLPQLLGTPDFVHFKFTTLNGPAVQNKGMALFPRKINGHYAMLSRQDDENILLMFSDNIHFWQTPRLLLSPAQPWEFFKIGNCGSPIETEAGWLVLSHSGLGLPGRVGTSTKRRWMAGAVPTSSSSCCACDASASSYGGGRSPAFASIRTGSTSWSDARSRRPSGVPGSCSGGSSNSFNFEWWGCPQREVCW